MQSLRMHVCSSVLQSRSKPSAVPGCTTYHLTASKHSRHREFCRKGLQVCARAASQSKRESAKPQGIESLDDAKAALASILGENSSTVEAITQAESAVEEGSLPEEYLDLVTSMANEIEGLVSTADQTEKLEKAEGQAKAANEKYLRLNADFDNFRKRSATEREQLGDRTRGDVVKNLIPLVDSFEAAQTSVTAETDNEKKINGAYQGLYKQMVEVFKGLGVEAVPGVGQPFDPNVHEAIMRELNDSMPDGTVLQEFRRGFKLGKSLLRPGMVKVSYSEGPTQANEDAAESEEEAPNDVEVEEAK